jgi:hypothetical protein
MFIQDSNSKLTARRAVALIVIYALIGLGLLLA